MDGERGIGYCASLRDADPCHSPWGPLQPKMGFELRSSRAITIENKTQLIAQPPPFSEQSLSLREDASSEYAHCAFYLKEVAGGETHFSRWLPLTNKKRQDIVLPLAAYQHLRLRRERDSNPRTREGQRFSRPPQSTPLPSLRVHKNTTLFLFCQIFAPKRVKTATQIEQPLLPKGPIEPNNSYRHSSESSVP